MIDSLGRLRRQDDLFCMDGVVFKFLCGDRLERPCPHVEGQKDRLDLLLPELIQEV